MIRQQPKKPFVFTWGAGDTRADDRIALDGIRAYETVRYMRGGL